MPEQHIGNYDSLEAALQKAVTYWGSPLTYQHGIDPDDLSRFILKEQGSNIVVGSVTIKPTLTLDHKKGKPFYMLKMRPRDPVFEIIQHDDRVTITNRHGQRQTGTARIRNQKAEVWVCAAKGNGTFLASQENVVQVKRGRKVIYGQVQEREPLDD